MAEISPVRDPTYEGFNYGQQLATAVQPIQALSQGRLAIAQQNLQRANDISRLGIESTLAGQRENQRLQTEANIRESLRQKERNESANQLFASVASRHPGFKPDSSNSLEENIAKAQDLNEQDTLSGIKPIADALAQEKADRTSVLQKYGAIVSPNDPKLVAIVNQQLIRDPSLVTGHFDSVLGPKEIAMLQSGKSAQDVAKTLNLTSNQRALLTAANTATTAVQQQLQERAAQLGQVELQGISEKYGVYHDLSKQVLNSIATTQPSLLGKAASLFSTPGTAGQPGVSTNPALDANGNLSALTGVNSTPPATPVAVSANPTAQKDAILGPIISNRDILARKSVYQSSKNNESALQTQVDILGHQLASSSDPDGEIAQQYLKAKQDLAKAQTTSAKALTEGISVHGDPFKQAVGFYPGGSNWPANMPAVITGPGQGQPASTPLFPAEAFTPNVLPNTPATTPQPAASSAAPGMFNQQAAANQAFQALGTSDPTVLANAKQFAMSRLGLGPQDIQNLLVGAVRGDPQSVQRVRSIIQQSQQQGSPNATPGFGATSSPPMPQPVPNTNGATVTDFSQ